jgi:hypothetical protein
MKAAIRLGVIGALLMGTGVARADHDPYTANSPHPQQATTETPTDEAPAPKMDAAKTVAGAGSMEPVEAIDEEPGTQAHQAWVEEIWTSP